MATTGPMLVTVGANNAEIGAVAWSTPGNVTADDGFTADCNTFFADPLSQYLVCRAANLLAVPANAVIVGVTVRAQADQNSPWGYSTFVNGRLQDNTGSLIGGIVGQAYSGLTPDVYVHGDPANLWGAMLTPAIVHSANFGVRLWFLDTAIIQIDYVSIEVEYTSPMWEIAEETEEALQLEHVGAHNTETADETDEAQALGATRIYSGGYRTEADTALALGLLYGHDPGVAAETDTALALSVVYIYPVGAAEETDAALMRNQDPYRMQFSTEADEAPGPEVGGAGGGPFVSTFLRPT